MEGEREIESAQNVLIQKSLGSVGKHIFWTLCCVVLERSRERVEPICLEREKKRKKFAFPPTKQKYNTKSDQVMVKRSIEKKTNFTVSIITNFF